MYLSPSSNHSKPCLCRIARLVETFWTARCRINCGTYFSYRSWEWRLTWSNLECDWICPFVIFRDLFGLLCQRKGERKRECPQATLAISRSALVVASGHSKGLDQDSCRRPYRRQCNKSTSSCRDKPHRFDSHPNRHQIAFFACDLTFEPNPSHCSKSDHDLRQGRTTYHSDSQWQEMRIEDRRLRKALRSASLVQVLSACSLPRCFFSL